MRTGYLKGKKAEVVYIDELKDVGATTRKFCLTNMTGGRFCIETCLSGQVGCIRFRLPFDRGYYLPAKRAQGKATAYQSPALNEQHVLPEAAEWLEGVDTTEGWEETFLEAERLWNAKVKEEALEEDANGDDEGDGNALDLGELRRWNLDQPKYFDTGEPHVVMDFEFFEEVDKLS